MKDPLFEPLHDNLKSYLSDDAIQSVYDAFLLAKKAHASQSRSSGEPYITHPVAVANVLADLKFDSDTIIAALLHDVIEDTDVTKEALAERFGADVASLVDGVSKLTQMNFRTRAEAQAANFRKMMMAMANDIRVILIKLADRLHNMRTLGHLSPEKRRRIARETLDIYAPIANRLGMRNFRDEFQRYGFKAMYPLRYKVLERAVKKARGNRKEILHTIENAIQAALEKAGLKSFELRGREKSLQGIYTKMRKKHVHLNDVMDVYAFRIIVDSVDLCYRALGTVHNLYKPVPERFKDYIAIPKSNGYQSLHTTLFGPYGLPIEIQIRTREMDRLAENGIAAHWLYKESDLAANDAQVRAREWIKNILEIQESTGTSLEFIENVKIDLFPDEVYVFTPEGEIMELPSGATAVDFAYAVHSDLGNSCIAVKIDKRLSPLSSRLKSGQKIEIVSAPGARPNPAWLNFVVTGKARSNIRHSLKSQQREESIALGRRMLDQALLQYSTTLEKITEAQLDHASENLSYKTADDLFEAIGLGYQMAPIIAQRLSGMEDHALVESQSDIHLTIRGTEGMAVRFAKCCHPIPGDPIIGVLTSGRGIVVHTESCETLNRFLQNHSDKCMPLRWESHLNRLFDVPVMVQLKDQRGALSELARAIADAESDVLDIEMPRHQEPYAWVSILLQVHDRVHLARVMRRVRQIQTVLKIHRQRHSER